MAGCGPISDPLDGEVYHNARLASGLHDYGGWFHFVGALAMTGDFPVVELAPSVDEQVECPSLKVYTGDWQLRSRVGG
jgi:hypothetical protein